MRSCAGLGCSGPENALRSYSIKFAREWDRFLLVTSAEPREKAGRWHMWVAASVAATVKPDTNFLWIVHTNDLKWGERKLETLRNKLQPRKKTTSFILYSSI